MSILKDLLRGEDVVSPGPGDGSRFKFISSNDLERVRLLAGRSIHIRADDVARYADETREKTPLQGIFQLPTVIAPFQELAIEYTRVSMPPHGNNAVECLLLVQSEKDATTAGWTNMVTAFARMKGERDCAIVLTGVFAFGVQSTGAIDQGRLKFHSPLEGVEISDLDVAAFCVADIYPGLFAISLMNCKNVRLSEEIEHQRRVRKHSALREHSLPRWRTLLVSPIRSYLKRVRLGAENSPGSSIPIHLCRGHFKDYRESGLFGKHKGIYWWDMNLRGDVKKGIIGKDYEIAAPN